MHDAFPVEKDDVPISNPRVSTSTLLENCWKDSQIGIFMYQTVATTTTNSFLKRRHVVASMKCQHSKGPLSIDHPGLAPEGPRSWNVSIFKLPVLRCKQFHWVVVSNIFYLHPYLGKWSNLTNIFQMGWNHQPISEKWHLRISLVGSFIFLLPKMMLYVCKRCVCFHFKPGV